MVRRAAISPESVGLPNGSRRRTPGLRREEVATLAGIGVTWYTWFEQGREMQVSARVLERIARALRLTPSDTEYLFSLSGTPRKELIPTSVERVDKHFQDTLDAIRGAPAFICNQSTDVLAYNQLGNFLFEFDACSGPFARNHAWRFFMDPKRREQYHEWEDLAKIFVPLLRLTQGKLAEDAYFNSLIQELYDGSAHFRRLWDEQGTGSLLEILKIGMKLPTFGDLYFNSVRFVSPDSRKFLMVMPPADEKTARVMLELSPYPVSALSNRLEARKRVRPMARAAPPADSRAAAAMRKLSTSKPARKKFAR
jgi:transcriptional regulator with XRE-family HTH domain